jgi:hypothetical protein
MQCCWTIVMLQKKKYSNLHIYLSIIGNVSLLLYISSMYPGYLVAMSEVGRVNCKKRAARLHVLQDLTRLSHPRNITIIVGFSQKRCT